MVRGLRGFVRFVTFGFATRTAWACSGPGAGDVIALSFQIALGTLVGLVIASVLVFVVPRLRPTTLRAKTFWIALPFLQLVAAMLLGTARGDCGYTLRTFSFGMMALGALAAVVGIFVMARRDRATA